MSSQFEFNSECLPHLFISVEFDTSVLFITSDVADCLSTFHRQIYLSKFHQILLRSDKHF